MSTIIEQDQYQDFFDIYETLTTETEQLEFIRNFIISKFKEQNISAMVGAGFSLNANPNYPDWANLLLDAYQEMHPNTPPRKRFEAKAKYLRRQLDYIRLIGEPNVAEEYENYCGTREALDLYIENHILNVDDSKTNLKTHKELLSLDWSDIITTNWDSLLEDSRNLTEYALVTTAKDLRSRNRKRIVKINGSIRSEEERNKKSYNYDGCYDHLYLITKKDFANYNKNHEDFSNFMKIKILENTFCLFGFSGNDYNFRYWVKELKRTMTKGGETKNPNPIFLFTLEESSDKALLQFYKNNYIIPINIFKFYSYINNINYIQNVYGIAPAFLFSSIFTYLKAATATYNNNSSENERITFKENNIKLLSTLINANSNTISDDFLDKYNQMNLFSFENLHFSSNCIYPLQSLFLEPSKCKENAFLFLYRWCLGNYYSLSNLFDENKINAIISAYNNSNFIESDAYVFAELILKFYRENGEYEKFENYQQKISKYSNLTNIIKYSKALSYIDSLDYKSLKILLDEWYPEEDDEPDSLFVIRKIALMSIFENAHFKESMKEDENQRKYVISLFTLALDNCKEGQLKLFIALLQRHYLQSFSFEPNYFNTPLIELLREQDFTDPYKYLEEFKITSSKINDISSNQSKRYSINWTLGGNGNNQGILNAIRIFNFFEYTGLSMDLFFDPKRIISMIPDIRKSNYFLIKMLIHCISYYGNDSEEDFAKNTLEKIIRYLQKTEIKSLYNAFFDILIYKVENNQNARSYLFVINELTKYLDKDSNIKFYNFIYNEIKKSDDNNNQIKNLIRRGKVWGAARPFNDYLNQITNKEEYQYILKWIINEYILDERALSKQEHYSPSEFFSYYFTLIQKNPNPDYVKSVFKDKEIINLLKEDFSYDKQLCLYGYEYLPKELKQKTKEFFEKDYTIHTDPFFIKHFKSETLKERILQIIKRDNILTYNSRNYPISTFIRMLYQEDMINIDDKKIICSILKDDYTNILEHIEHFNYGFKSLKDNISEFFYCLEEITTVQERKDYPEINETYEIIKKEFLNQIKPFYTFDWLYNSDTQKFRISFTNAVSYFSYLRQAKQYLYIFNIVLSKLIVQDDSNFEAVLELFVNIYSKNYEKSVLKNKDTHELLIQLMKKYKQEIPYCYDYLFMKKQMKLLATALKKNIVQDEVIEYWINEE